MGNREKLSAENYRQLCNLILFLTYSVILLVRIIQPVFFNTRYFQNDVLDILGNEKDAYVMCLTKTC